MTETTQDHESRQPYWGSLATMAEHWAAVQGDRAALTTPDGRSLTFAELDERGARVAAALDGSGPVAFLGRDVLTWATAMVGASRRGVPALPLNWRLSGPELERLLAHSKPSVIVCDNDLGELINAGTGDADSSTVVRGSDREVIADYEDWVAAHQPDREALAPDPTATALLVYTSGTSGMPKAVALSNANIAANLATPAPWEVDTAATVGVPAPLFHVSGTGWVFYCLGRGAHFVATAGVSPAEVFDILRRERATHMLTVPAILQTLIRMPGAADEGLPDLHTVIYGGSPMPPVLITQARQVLGCDLVQSYGMTETCGPISFLTQEDHRAGGARLASAGRSVPGVELQVRPPGGEGLSREGETGEVWTRSALVTPGYLDNDEQNRAAFDADNWFRTGDLGHLDADGYLYLTDRMADMIITGGENVYPVEVENVLAEHPLVEDVAVVGAPDDRWGETVVAVVVPTAGAHPEQSDLIEYCRTRIAHYKSPTRVLFVDELPRNAGGKILKKNLRAELADEQRPVG